MVRKSIPPNRAKRGFIPSGNPTKDRARMVHALIQHYKNRIDEDIRPKLITKATEILEIGDAYRDVKTEFYTGKLTDKEMWDLKFLGVKYNQIYSY